MTFEEFVASKQWRELTAFDQSLEDEQGNTREGWVYADSFWIESVQGDHWPEHCREEGKWYLIVERSEWIDDDLSKLERILWDEFAAGEINGPCERNGHRDTGRGVCADCGAFLDTKD
jgi:hypothetical protein